MVINVYEVLNNVFPAGKSQFERIGSVTRVF